jgi:hypothetical protein
MEPQATKVPAEKKLIKSESPPMNQGTASPAAKKDLRFLPVLEKENPTSMIKTEKITITEVSIAVFISLAMV